MPVPDGFRDRVLRAMVLLGVAVFAITESLSAFQAIHRVPLLVGWAFIAAGLAVYLRFSRLPRPKSTLDPVVVLAVLGMKAILVLTRAHCCIQPSKQL